MEWQRIDADAVGRALVAEWRLIYRYGAVSPRVGDVRPLKDGVLAKPRFDIIGITAGPLGYKSDARTWLLIWAKAQAGFEPSVTDWLKAHPSVSPSTFHRTVNEAKEIVAAFIRSRCGVCRGCDLPSPLTLEKAASDEVGR
jgi:hypothetical protein